MLRSTVDNKFLTVHRERLKLCLAEPFHEQDVQHVEAEQTAPDIIQPPQPLHVPQPPINQIAPPPAQPLGFPQANALVLAAQAVQLLPGAPVQAAAAINLNPLQLTAIPQLLQANPDDPRADGRPKRQTRPPDRLIDQYAFALAMPSNPRRK